MPTFDFTLPDFMPAIPLELLVGAALLTFGVVVALLWLHRRVKLRKSVRRLERKRPKAYTGEAMLKYTKKHRKTGANTHKKLRAKGRKRFARYLGFKRRELRTVLKHLDKKAFGQPKSKLAIRVMEEGKEVKRIKWPIGLKAVIRLIDRYECLDEWILYLDALPRAVAVEKPFTYTPKTKPITFTYELE